MTQDGIALHVGVMRSAVARELTKLKPEGLLDEVSKHVVGEKRKRKVYFLSERGTQVALEIKERLLNEETMLPTEDGHTQIKMVDLPAKFELSLAEAVRFVRSNRVFDREGALEYIGERGTETEGDGSEEEHEVSPKDLRSLELSDKVPSYRHFFGREEEMKKIQESIDSPDCRFIIIQGMAGIGKTTLAAKVVNDNRDKSHIFWYSFGRWNSFRNIMIPFSDFLKKLEKPRLSSYLRTGKDFEFGHFLHLVEEEAQDAGVLMVFDNFHYTDEKTRLFFGSLLDVMERVPGSTLMVISRDLPQFYNRAHVKVKGLVAEFRLEGLDMESCKAILEERKMGTEAIGKIFALTNGHPLALELIDSYDEIGHQRDVRQFLEEEVRRELTEPEAALLGLASVYRYPVKASAFFPEDELAAEYDTLSMLCRRSLVNERQDNTYDVHDLVREFFYNRLTPKQSSSYHMSAADYYCELPDDLSLIEMMHHLIQAGEQKEAVSIALEEGPGLLYKGYVEFVNILEQLGENEIGAESLEGISALKEDAQTRMGGLGFAPGLVDEDPGYA
jgi:DNA-binding PadR family transcriptional regulator